VDFLEPFLNFHPSILFLSYHILWLLNTGCLLLQGLLISLLIVNLDLIALGWRGIDIASLKFTLDLCCHCIKTSRCYVKPRL